MADTTKIQGPIEIKDNSAERVAYELFMYISTDSPQKQEEQLELYAKCLLTVKHPNLGLETIKKRVKGLQG